MKVVLMDVSISKSSARSVLDQMDQIFQVPGDEMMSNMGVELD
jgi:hypothetical protein